MDDLALISFSEGTNEEMKDELSNYFIIEKKTDVKNIYTDEQFEQCLKKFKKMFRSSGPNIPASSHEVWLKMSQFLSQISGTKNVISAAALRKNVYENKFNAHIILGIRRQKYHDGNFFYCFVSEKEMLDETSKENPISELDSDYEAVIPRPRIVPSSANKKARSSNEQNSSIGTEGSLLLKIKEYESDGDWLFCKSVSTMMKEFPADVKNNLKFEILQLTMKKQIEQMNKE